ncbi:chemotaxis protein CheW [Marinihelvus fidelis]|nr:chemotaxis protein CheW [Marinihelvus fidelis]
MSTVNASFAKLLEYELRARGAAHGDEDGGPAKGDWAGLAFRVGGAQMVCGMERVSESLPLPQVTRVPGTKPFILGLANVRGDLVTIVDLGCYLSGQRTRTSPATRVLSSTLRGRAVGLVVDEVFGQRNFLDNDADPADVPDSSPLHGLVRRAHRAGSESWQELDLDTLFRNPDFLDGAAA